MIFYITVLRALAAILITNAHYVGVYPTDLFANGGLLGDVIFFAVSGFCLENIKYKFLIWYGKRIIRIYPIVWIITLIYILLGFYSFEDWTVCEYLLYPTYYHFVASIMTLYVGFFIIMKLKTLADNIPKIMFWLFIIELIIYILFYDKSNYHIDTVREPMIRFLFFQAMILGAYFRKYQEKFMDKNRMINWFALSILSIIYFFLKLAFDQIKELSTYQIINQIVLFILLYYVLKCFASINNKLEALPFRIKAFIVFIAKITLEIYVVQYVVIAKLSTIIFPLNWVVITGTIIILAFILHIVAGKVSSGIEIRVKNLFQKN
jgi:peptidoglycan/LPS O-acetylase OafA/YrhL